MRKELCGIIRRNPSERTFMQEVTLMEVLNAREFRAFRQKELLDQYKCTLICFTMNIAGPIKTSPLILNGYLEGLGRIHMQLKFASIQELHFEEIRKNRL
jgi:Phosphoribosyl-dephospho-CoA transferase (holo-ACP synthetase)